MDKNIYTAIDASLNRSLEGLRVCEDIVRFALHDPQLSKKMKHARHACVLAASQFEMVELIRSRDVQGDTLKFHDHADEKRRDSIESVFRVNLHRATEAVRSLEEMSKLLPKGDSASFQAVRFSLYEIEKDFCLLFRKAQYLKRFEDSLYAILDAGAMNEEQYTKTAKMLIAGGAAIIEIQVKSVPKNIVYAVADKLSPVCRESDVIFIVDEYPEIAVLAGAAGVCLGPESLLVSQVRRLVADDMLIGLSVESSANVEKALAQGPDFLRIGFVNKVMPNSESTLNGEDLEMLKEICSRAACPVVISGELNATDIPLIKKTGCSSFVMQSFLYKDDKIVDNCKTIIKAIARE